MLEFLRKKQGALWIVITVVVIISFAFFGNATQSKPPGVVGPEDTAFSIYGKNHSNAELGRLLRLHSLSSMLGLEVEGIQAPFADALSYIVRTFQFQESVQPDFAFNLLVLRHELKKNGIHVNDDEAREAFRNLPLFKNEKGEFDGGKAEFINSSLQNQLGQLGLRLPDMYELLRDWVGLQKLVELVSGNVVAPGQLTEQFYKERFQNIKVATIPFSRDTYKKDIKPSDEEISKYFEERKDEFKSEEQRAVSYVFFPNPATENLKEEDRTKAVNANAEKVNAFAVAVIAPKAVLADEAKKVGVEVKTVPAFSRNEAPAELKDEFQVVSEIFSNDSASRPISDPVEGSKGYYIFSVTEVKAPVPLTLDQAKANIIETLVNQKAEEALAKASNETRKKIEEAIKGGKNFADASKDAGVTPQNLADFSPANPLTDISNGRQIAFAAASTPAGSFTKEPVAAENGMVLVFVVNKELHKREDSAITKTQLGESIDRSLQLGVFRAWFERRREESKLDAKELIQRTLGSSASA